MFHRNSLEISTGNAAESGVPALRLSHPANFGPLEVGCDKRANANAGTPICEFLHSTGIVSGLCRSLCSSWSGILIVAAVLLSLPTTALAAEPIKALIVDGQNNHAVWPTTTKMMKKYLEETKLFSVDVATAAPAGTDINFKPDFSKYAVVISNFGHGAAPWPEATQKAFETFVSSGGGFVVVHAADNSFPEWPAYNEMIGLGGWGGRTEKDGPYVYVNDKGETVRDETPGNGGNHGTQWEFPVIVRDHEHPITKGMPSEWLHAKDELYDKLRGPARKMQILATAESQVTGHNEPMIFTIDYGKGRVFHTPMGHAEYSIECVGFITTFQRGTEWAATGKVTLPIPDDFPTAEKTSSRAFVE